MISSVLPWHEESLRALVSRRDRMPHALLVSGPAGVGKGLFARSLAQTLLCEAPKGQLACGECPACNWFSQGNHPDFREVIPEADEESPEGDVDSDDARESKAKSLVIKIGQVRAVSDFMTLSTHRAGFRVLILRPAEAMQAAAANALLKTLEEPPPATAIVLVSDQPSRLLPTIRSRCQTVILPAPPIASALAWLRAQSVESPEEVLALAGGAPLLARDLADSEAAAWRRRAIAELARPDGAAALNFAAGIDKGRVEPLLFVLQTWVEDLVRVKSGAHPRRHRGSDGALRAKARRARLDRLLGFDRELTQARRLANHPLNPRLFAEHLLLSYNRATLD